MASGRESVQEIQFDLFETIGERYIEKDKDVYAIFVDLEKAFDRVVWKKLMGIMKKERRLLSNLHMKQRMKVRVVKEMSEGRKTGRGTARKSSIAYTLQNH